MNWKRIWGILVFAWSVSGAPAGEWVTAWNFNGLSETNAPPPAVGTGSAALLGGVEAALAAGAGSSDPEPSATDFAWNLTRFPARGDVAVLAGAEFRAGTAGYRDIAIRVDLRPSNTASRRVRFQYSVDGEVFVDGPVMDLVVGGVFTNGLALDLSDVPGVDDNPRFAFRVVSVPDADTEVGGFVAVSGRYSPTGTWRLDMVGVQGVSVGGEDPGPPLPSGPPALRYTHVLSGMVRTGDALTNTFTELAVGPGEGLDTQLELGSPDGIGYGVELISAEGLPAGSGWLEPAPERVERGEASVRFVFRPTAAEAGMTFEVGAAAFHAGGTNRVVWRIHVPTVAERGLVLTEFLANPVSDPAHPAFNPLRRDPPSSRPGQHDEFVELVNFGGEPLDLEGWRVRDATGWRHTFRQPTVLGPSNVVVLHGGPVSGAATGLDPEVMSIGAGEGIVGLSLNNDRDLIALYNPDGDLVFRVVYTPEWIAAAAGGAIGRRPDAEGPFGGQAGVGDLAVTPGRRADGTPFAAVPDDGENPEPVRLAWEQTGAGGVELRWVAEVTAAYAVWAAEILAGKAGAWLELARDLVFPEGEGRYPVAVDPGRPARFFRVEGR